MSVKYPNTAERTSTMATRKTSEKPPAKALADAPSVPRRSLRDILNFDIDTYLVNGGKFLDLELPSHAAMEVFEKNFAHTLDDSQRERMARMGRFFELVGRQAGEAKVDDTLTEERLQYLWRTSA